MLERKVTLTIRIQDKIKVDHKSFYYMKVLFRNYRLPILRYYLHAKVNAHGIIIILQFKKFGHHFVYRKCNKVGTLTIFYNFLVDRDLTV